MDSNEVGAKKCQASAMDLANEWGLEQGGGDLG